ncbi:hypothetical protein BDR04DRAFT_1120940 [Suillus decipiens]|nr:hypothetical protein BDR04DRAFT_1120940 [Suillus decipiens]
MASHETPTSPSRTTFHTPPNIFGLVHQYFSSAPPSHDPEEYVTMADLSFIPGSHMVSKEEHNAPVTIASDSQYYPYPNHSSFQLGDWYWNQGIQKSQEDYIHLLKIIGSETFNTSDVSSTHWNEINSKLGANEYDQGDIEEWEDEDAGWRSTPVFINVPFSRTTEVPGPRAFRATNLYHCSLVAIIQENLTNARDNKLFHYELYKLCWNPPHLDGEVPIYGDLFMSPLTSFGNTKLWPTYMYFGNESKYHCCKLSCNISNHVVYFEMLPHSFKDFTSSKGMNSNCSTHCHRELFHKQWNILSDDEFLEAYEHGIVIHCCDGITRRFYPRIFTYSADYPENSVRSLIYDKDLGVGSTAVECLLKPQSWVPTSNTFSDRLAALGFNVFCTLVVDLLHKFELGVWKMLFIHLLWILMAEDKSLINKLDQRQTPTFGPATIRKFSANASDMSCMAAQNFKDLLQSSP